MIATVLGHELQHAADWVSYGAPRTPADCLDRETRAFTFQTLLWTGGFRDKAAAGSLGSASAWTQTSLFQELDGIAALAFRDPTRLARTLRASYLDQCG